MKFPAIILGGLVFMLSQTSCTKYYYSFIQSDRMDSKKNELGDFVQENDSVRIIYSFHGEDLPVNITICNKTEKALYVDWKESALIVQDLTPHFAGKRKKMRGDNGTASYSYQDGEPYQNVREVYDRYQEPLYSSEGTSFIPPQSRINRTPVVLSNFKFFQIPTELYTKKPFLNAEDQEKKVDVISFTENNSPVRFRSYLTLFTREPDGRRGETMTFEQTFYISTLIRGGKKNPNYFRQFTEQRGDFFFVRDERGKNAGTIAGIIGIGVTGIALEIATGPYEYYGY